VPALDQARQASVNTNTSSRYTGALRDLAFPASSATIAVLSATILLLGARRTTLHSIVGLPIKGRIAEMANGRK
jgi:hypothetical protein